MDSLTAAIVDTASALSQQRIAGQMNVRALRQALDAQAQQALALLQSLPPPGQLSPSGHRIDLVA